MRLYVCLFNAKAVVIAASPQAGRAIHSVVGEMIGSVEGGGEGSHLGPAAGWLAVV